jgi:uncharacterized protein (TIGR00661 family)
VIAMSRILYGVAGEGFGHCSRAHLIGQHLLDTGHDVRFVGFGKVPSALGPLFKDRVHRIEGLSFAYRKGRISQWRTFTRNLAGFPRIVRENRRLLRSSLEGFVPDVVMTDFEPFSAWWARMHHVPLVSVDNEHVLTRCRLQHASSQILSRWIAQSIIHAYVIRPDATVVLNFFKAPVRGRSTVLAPPVVRTEVTRLRPSQGDYLVVYVSTGQGREALQGVLDRFPGHRFIVYGYDAYAEQGHCLYKRISTAGFLQDLAGSRGVIASAGFSLLSECMALQKRMLLVPVAGQYEQRLNARYAEQLGLGLWCRQLTPASLSRFLSWLDHPTLPHADLLWPDNERFFAILQGVLDRLALTGRGARPPHTSQ